MKVPTQSDWKVIRDRLSFGQLEATWQRLGKESEASTPFQAFSWCRQWLEYRGQGSVPYVLVSDDQTVLAPFIKTVTAGIRVLRLMGTGDSDYLGLVTSKVPTQAWAMVMEELSRRKEEWDLLHFHSIAQPKEVLNALKMCKGMEAITREYESCPYISIRGSWEEYLARRKKVKYESKRWARRLSELGTLSVEVSPTPVNTTLLREMIEVEQSSWKWELGTAALKPGGQADFVQAVLQDPLMPARVWLLRMSGTLMAFAVVFEGKRGWYYYLPSYRKECPNSGAYLLGRIVKEAFRADCTSVDLLQGDHGYKTLWTDEVTDVSELVAAQSFKGKLALRGFQMRWLASKSHTIQRIRNWMLGVGDRR
jgi:CelD/BcsL family acetyltransferase involved in cellulose biosynthesis